MHHMKLKAAVNKYLPLVTEGKTTEELIEAIAQDEAGYTSDEVNEIVAAVTAPGAGEKKGPEKTPEQSDPPKTLNRKYEEWKVKAVVSHKANSEGDKVRMVNFEKDAMKPIRTTMITPDKAEVLNSQSENTLLRLYEA